jgi:hypothetical protein
MPTATIRERRSRPLAYLLARLARLAALAALAALLVLLVSCAESGPNFSVNYAPGFAKDKVSISVFGVFRDGRMNPEAWDELGPRLSAALQHKDLCEVAVGTSLRALQSSLFAAVDSVARADGITDDLLTRFAPAATGDTILVLTVAGRPPKNKDTSASASAPQISPGGARPGRGGRRSSTSRPSGHGGDTSVFEMSASLFSKKQRQSVAMVSMAYTGVSEDEAIARFVEKVAAAFPGATCAGWSADLGLDAAAIERPVAP